MECVYIYIIDGIYICIYIYSNLRYVTVFIPPVNGLDVILLGVCLWQLSKTGRWIRQCLDLTQYVCSYKWHIFVLYMLTCTLLTILYIMAENMTFFCLRMGLQPLQNKCSFEVSPDFCQSRRMCRTRGSPVLFHVVVFFVCSWSK